MRNVEESGAGDEQDAVAVVGRRLRQAVSHFARRTVGDVSYGVNGFSGGTGRDEETHGQHYAESWGKVKSDLVQRGIMFRLDSCP